MISNVDPATRRRLMFLTGVGGVAIAVLLGLLAPHNGAVWRAPAVLKERVSTALSAEGFPGLDVEMNDMLPVQIVQSGGDFHADIGDLRIGQRKRVNPFVQCMADDAFHHQKRLHGEIARGNELGNVHAGQSRPNHLLHFETEDGRRVRTFADARHLHQHRRRHAGTRDTP